MSYKIQSRHPRNKKPETVTEAPETKKEVTSETVSTDTTVKTEETPKNEA